MVLKEFILVTKTLDGSNFINVRNMTTYGKQIGKGEHHSVVSLR